MHIDLVSLFPEALAGYLASSIVGRARRRGLLSVDLIDPRWYAGGRYRVVDARPYGGGPGMVLGAEPLGRCLDALLGRAPRARLLATSPQGRRLDAAWAEELAGQERLIVLCGHYEGIDERVLEHYRPEELSIGDVVLSGGEPAALVLIDAIARLVPGVLGDERSAIEDSFADGLLDHPCYTKPRVWRGREVPPVLCSGDHAAIAAWRREQRRERTRARRPDLLARIPHEDRREKP
ncbi:MAG: tRNA (guanosine(37)-N1)-methyltransferase TrmD [Planctomycetota bacterium]